MATNKDLEEGKKLLSDQVDEVGFLDSAFKSLAATISTTLEDAIDQMNGLDTITKKVAQSYQKDIANSIKKTTSGLEETIALQLKIKQGVNVEADIKKKMDAAEVRRVATLKKIMMVGKELGVDTMEMKVQLKEQYDLEIKMLKAMEEQNAAKQKAKPLFQLLKENAGSIADKIDKSGTLSKVLSGGIKSVLTPMRLLELAIVGVFDAMVSVDKLNGELAKNLNISVSEAAELSTELSEAANKSGSINITTKGLGKALLAVNEITGVYTTENSKNLETLQLIHKASGLTYEQMSGIYSVTQATGGDLEKNTKEVLAQSTLTAQSLGVQVNSKKILADIGKISKATTLSLGMSAQELSKALTTSKALGIEMSTIEGISESLLNFESSIEKELEAELLLGKNINLEKARQAALNNDIATVAEEIAKQAGSAADFAKMNRIQQQALAEAVGLSREELANSLFVQEQLANSVGKEYEEKKKIIDELQAKGLSQDQIKEKLGKESLADLKAQSSIQENLNKSVVKLKELFVSIAGPLMQIITPIVDILIPAVGALGVAFELVAVPMRIIGDGVKMLADGIKQSTDNMVVFGTAAAAFLAIQRGITASKIAQFAISKKDLALEKAKQVQIKISSLLSGKDALKNLALYAFNAAKSVAGIPIVGPVLGAAALAAAYMGGKALLKGDDVMSPGGYGSRTLMGPEGAIALNNKDTVIAGTNLFPKESGTSSPQTIIQQDNSEAKKTNALLEALINKPAPKVQMDSIEVGTVAGMSAFSIQ